MNRVPPAFQPASTEAFLPREKTGGWKASLPADRNVGATGLTKVPGSWSQCARKGEKGLPMNLSLVAQTTQSAVSLIANRHGPGREWNGRALACIAGMSLALLASGCSTFNRDWQAAAKNPAPANDIAGRWQGTWLSDKNHHTDKLRCLISKIDDGKYQARYYAQFANIFRFGYTVSLAVEQKAGRYQFKGEADLGRIAGGVYHYEGEATATNFFSKYECGRDYGTFRMTRPESSPIR